MEGFVRGLGAKRALLIQTRISSPIPTVIATTYT